MNESHVLLLLFNKELSPDTESCHLVLQFNLFFNIAFNGGFFLGGGGGDRVVCKKSSLLADVLRAWLPVQEVEDSNPTLLWHSG